MTLKEWAYKYRNIGWNVIPLFNHSKIPSAVNWKEYQQRQATVAEIEQWFSRGDITGIGVITGKISGIVAIDEDSYKADGMKFDLISPMITKTARGGRHHFFHYAEPIKTSGWRQGVNIEIKADGGFLVLPPSQVLIDGEIKEYEWLKKCSVAKLPVITEKELLPYRGGLTPNGAIELREFLHGQKGTRHNDLRTIALVIFNRFRKDDWELAEKTVRTAALDQDPPLKESEVNRVITDVQQFILQHPKDALKEESKNRGKVWNPETVNDLLEERLEDLELEKLAPSTGWPELDRLVKGFIPKHIYTLTGDTNVGKTTLAANFAEALREQNRKVLYIALEPDINILDYFASVRTRKPFDELTKEDRGIIGQGNDLVKIFRGKDINEVQDLVDAIEEMEEKFDLVIIDHIGYFVNSERNWIQQQGNIIKQLAGTAKSKKIAIMMIAHLRKPAIKTKKPGEVDTQSKFDWIPTQNDIAGSAAFKQDSTDVFIAIRQTKAEDEFHIQFANKGFLLVTKTKSGMNGAVPLIFTERGALVMSLAQINNHPVEKANYELQEHQEQQLRLGNVENDPWEEDSN